MRSMRRAVGVAITGMIAMITSAHVGSPDVVFDGEAGPYAVRVIVRPPDVVPGLAEVIVRAASADVQRVTAAPVFYRAGAAGAPRADELRRVAGQQDLYAGTLWLMSRGSSSVYVTVSGARGSGTAIVPVAALSTSRLALSRGLAAILVVLGCVLFAGLVTIVRAASGEALLEPGRPVDDATRRRSRTAVLVAAPVLALLVLGGARWWTKVDGDYRRLMYKPPMVTASFDARHLTLVVRDTASFRTILAAPIPDHGKMMHLFLIGEGSHDVFAHLHPMLTSGAEFDSLMFTTNVPWIPAGRYRLFGDIVLANGMSFTVTRSLLVNADSAVTAPSDSDDSWAMIRRAAPLRPGAVQPLGDSLSLAYTGDSPIRARTPVDLSFEVRAPSGVIRLEPFLGMAAHAVVLRSDDSVFIHLHPMGTVSTDAQRAFAERDSSRGTGSVASMTMAFDGRIRFPYEFPEAGRYRVFVQVKADKRVLTGAFDLDVR